MKCDCAERIGIKINSYDFFIELKELLRDRSRKVYLRMFQWKSRIISVIVKVQTHYTGMLINGTDAMHAERYGNLNILIFRQQEK